jgi:hydrogenase maturation protease
MSALVIGIGNRFRRDDGVGPAVLDALDGRVPAAALVEADGEPARLLDLWSEVARVVVVDAARTGAAPGTCRSFEVTDGAVLPAGPATSSHAAGVGEAWGLGRALGRLPHSLTVVAVEAADLGEGPGLSPEVAAAVPVAAGRVLALLEGEPCA